MFFLPAYRLPRPTYKSTTIAAGPIRNKANSGALTTSSNRKIISVNAIRKATRIRPFRLLTDVAGSVIIKKVIN